LEYHLIVARDTHAICISDFNSLRDQTVEVRKMLHGLQKQVVALPRKPAQSCPDVVT
jgi:hypothetical protein